MSLATYMKTVILLTIKTQRPIKWVNDCGCLVDYDMLTKAVIWYADSPVQRVKHIYLFGKYAAVTVNRKKVHVHRLLVEYCIDHKLPTYLSVHHLDENKLNNNLSNLAIMVSKYHNSHHMKGKKPTENQRRATTEANRRRKGTRIAKRVDIPLDMLKNQLSQGMSVNAIARYYHCDWSTIKERIHENPELLEE